MGKKLYVGNLPSSASSAYLEDAFSSCGRVEKIEIMKGRDTGQTKAFACVEMANEYEAQSVISKYNGTDYEGNILKISEAKPMRKRSNDNRPKKGW